MKKSTSRAWTGAFLATCASASALASDVSVSGFGTLGYARSDQPFNYQVHVNDQGTLKQDSLFGMQIDARLNDQVSLTLQARAAPSATGTHGVDAEVSWAFVSWRPSNDWLLRLGRMRAPFYLQSESTDVGITFDYVRFPAEVYSTSPTTDFDGISVSKTWSLATGELSLDGYVGGAYSQGRTQLRDSSAVVFTGARVSSRGLVLTWTGVENIVRAGAHDVYIQLGEGQTLPVVFPFVSLQPGLGYYQITNQMAGPGVLLADRIHVPVFTLGADVALGQGVRMMGEYVRRDVRHIVSGTDTQNAYIALRKTIGAWTPYVSVGRLLTVPDARNSYKQVNTNTLPAVIPGAVAINASQRIGADLIGIYDQSTRAVGTSYRINPTSSLKAEWARVSTGAGSSLLDVPPGAETGKRVINVWSVSYNFVF